VRPGLGLLLVFACLLAACGTSRPRVIGVATIGGEAVSRVDYQNYVRYAVSFYRSEFSTSARNPSCNPRSSACRRLQRQVLRRLLEEAVVLRYARDHHITLTAADRAVVKRQLSALEVPGSPTATLLQRKVVSHLFLEKLVETQVLVQKVEKAVLAGKGANGPSFHLRIIAIPRGVGVADPVARQEALNLATDGQPVPADAHVRVEWIAAFRLAAHIRAAVSLAQPGDYTGPFHHRRAYLVVQLLGHGIHAYGKPARDRLQTEMFRNWIDNAVLKTHPTCQNQAGRTTPCPGPND
jgi:hypothetical protein